MSEDYISFEEIDKNTASKNNVAQYKQPVRGYYDTLYAELKDKCNPANFMEPYYDPEKVSKANVLYSKILSTDKSAEVELKALRLRAIKELGIIFSTERLYRKLTKACNPKLFTGDSYDKEQLELANRLYQQTLQNADNVIALEKIEKSAEILIKLHKDELLKDDNVSQQDVSTGDISDRWAFIIALFVICFCFIVYCFTRNN